MALGLGANLGTPEEIAAVLRQALDQLAANLGGAFRRRLSPRPRLAAAAFPRFPQHRGRRPHHPGARGRAGGRAKALEMAAGRRPGPRLAARPLDIDLLIYGDRLSAAPELDFSPHPRLGERRFVVTPLNEIAPYFVPPRGTPVSQPQPPAGQRVRRLSRRIQLARLKLNRVAVDEDLGARDLFFDGTQDAHGQVVGGGEGGDARDSR